MGGQATGKDKSEALCHPSHLFRGVRRANTVHDQGDAGLYILAGFLTMGAQPLQEGPPGMSVVFGAKHLEAVGNGPGVRQAVKIRQHGLVHGQAHKAHFLAASGLQAVFRKLVGKAQPTTGEEEQPPRQQGAGCTVAAARPLDCPFASM